MNIVELHSAAWAQLSARRAQLPHALLLSGRRGIGKFDLARRFSEALLCEAPSAAGFACGVCPACGWLAQGNHPDFRLLQPEALAAGEGGAGEGGEGADASGKKKASQQITIAQVRALDDFLHVGTHRHGARIVLVYPAEAMNRSTANSLLKSLEEPVAGTLFILVSSEPARLLPTIRSRCQALPIAQPSRARAEAWLRDAGVGDAAHWLALAGGSPQLAVELAGSDQGQLLEALIDALARGALADPLTAAAALDRVIKAEKRPAALVRTIEWTQRWLFDLTLLCAGLAPRYFLAHSAALQRLARTTEIGKLLAFARKAIQYRAQCEQPLNSRLLLEEFFLNYAALFDAS
jgi:DNA polymerase-3 subunit delta'